MNYISLLTDDETRYICSVIPPKNIINYFKKNSKEFAKIFPGFRPNTIGHKNVGELLVKYRDQRFISSFIEMNINKWINQIKEHINKCRESGDNKDLAYLHTLPSSFFVDNVFLYFKLTGEEYSESYVSLLAFAVKEIKKMEEKQEKSYRDLESKKSELMQMQLNLDSTASALGDSENKVKKYLRKVNLLECATVDIEKLKIDLQSKVEKNSVLTMKIRELENIIQKLRAELLIANDKYQEFKIQCRNEKENQSIAEIIKYEKDQKPLCPNDLDEFKEYLGYNLVSIGISSYSEYYFLLKEHLGHILFQGIPIVINRHTAKSLIKCIANSLIGTINIETLVYNNNISLQIIEDFLLGSGRIVCLDNFIGNYNETELLTLFEKYRNKIIFLTVLYDRTLHFVPSEFLKYCHYLNLNRIKALSDDIELSEDPSTLEEVEFMTNSINIDLHNSGLLREILSEFGICKNLIEYKCNYVFNEQDLCRILAFEVLPYCIDVMQISPYNISERLVKYAGNSGRCLYKNLFKRWFI